MKYSINLNIFVEQFKTALSSCFRNLKMEKYKS